MATLTDLASRMQAIKAGLPQAASLLSVGTAMAMETYLTQTGTPVDTSNALSNWQVSLDAPIENEIGPYSLGSKGSTRNESASSAINEAQSVLDNKQPGQIIYISNNAPYIQDLNDGSSAQSPGGFDESAVIIGVQYIQSNKIVLE